MVILVNRGTSFTYVARSFFTISALNFFLERSVAQGVLLFVVCKHPLFGKRHLLSGVKLQFVGQPRGQVWILWHFIISKGMPSPSTSC